MFRAKQVQTLDVAEIMDRILENHDSKVVLDNLKTYLNRVVHKRAMDLANDEDIRKNAESGYSWNYEKPLENTCITVQDLISIIGYEIPIEDAQIFHENNEKYKKYYAESHCPCEEKKEQTAN